MDTPYQAILSAPFGSLGIRCESGVTTGIDFLTHRETLFISDDAGCRAICDGLQAYLENGRVPINLPVRLIGTEFQQQVWLAIRQIPPGSTITYGELASRVDSGARAVANACGANPVPLIIPCHRVVGSNGLGGFMGGRDAESLHIKTWLLTHESGYAATTG